MRSRRLLLAAMLLLCVVGRGAYVLYLVHTNAVITAHGDTPTYLRPARELVDHGRFDNGGTPNEPEFLRTPGYPVFVAAVYGVFGKSNTAVLLVQVALSALTVFLAYLLAARIWSVPIGLLAALFTLLEPLQNATSATLLTETLTALLLIVTAAVGFVALTDDTPRPKLFALLGLVTACATLVRPSTYYLPLLVLAILVVRRARGRARWRDLAKITVAFLVPIVVLVGGWQLRNHERVDSWQFSGIEAKNVYHYRAAGVVARSSGIPFAEAQRELSVQLGPRGRETQGAYYGRMYHAGLHILTAHPVDTVVVTGKGLWSELFSVRVKFFEYLGSHPASGAPVALAEAVLVAFYATCAYGMVLAIRRGREASAHVFVAGVALYILIASAGPEAMGGRGERFRAPIMPILIIYAAFGAHALYTARELETSAARIGQCRARDPRRAQQFWLRNRKGRSVAPVTQVPTGMVTFLFTDMEGSTRRWEDDPDAMQHVLARHDAIVRQAVDQHDGYVFATGGDGFAVAFARPDAAIDAAVSAQLGLSAEQLPPVRMGVHTGEAHERGGDYFGPTVNRSARLMAIGHGGQVLVSSATAELVAGFELRDLGAHRLRDLSRSERVFQLVVTGVNNEFPSLRSLDLVPTNLPVQSSRFVGRTEEMRRVIAGLEHSRLVTLTGVGGVGKTRLALQVTAEVLPAYPDGVWLVELAGVADPAMVGETVRSVLGVQQRPGRSIEDCVVDHFSSRCLLLVIDNCEHVIGAAAELTSRLVSSAGGSRVLATSREGLAVPGERVVAVPPLAVPSEDLPEMVLASDAVRLFIDRAADARDGFSADDADVAILARLCRRLDGIPLAIELAAARVRSIAVADILAHLDQRFRLLSTGRRTAPTRQQTLRNAIDWSYELLEAPERIMLRRLSVFAGGFDLAAVAATVTDESIAVIDAVNLLDRLVDKSLVVVDVSSDTTRYRLLETIRDYGWERLEEAEETVAFARQHAEYFATFSAGAGAGLRGPDEARWSDLIEAEMENLRLALTWAIANEEADLALRIVGGLAVSGYRVGVPFGSIALDAAELGGAAEHPLLALALASVAWTTFRLGEYERATELGEAALEAARSLPPGDEQQRILGQSLSVLTSVVVMRPGMFDRGAALAGEREEVARALGDHYETVQALTLRAPLLGDAAAAEESVRLARIVKNPTMLSYALSVLAMLIIVSDPVRARDLVDESARAADAVGNEQAVALAQQVLGAVLGRLGDHVTAVRMGLTAAEQLFEQGERFYAFSQLWGVAASLNALGDHNTAVVLGAWLMHQGAEISGPSGLPPRASVNLSNELTVEEVERCDPEVGAMTGADIIAFGRAQLAGFELLASLTPMG